VQYTIPQVGSTLLQSASATIQKPGPALFPLCHRHSRNNLLQPQDCMQAWATGQWHLQAVCSCSTCLSLRVIGGMRTMTKCGAAAVASAGLAAAEAWRAATLCRPKCHLKHHGLPTRIVYVATTQPSKERCAPAPIGSTYCARGGRPSEVGSHTCCASGVPASHMSSLTKRLPVLLLCLQSAVRTSAAATCGTGGS
jgi:hypothetical protein